MPSLGAGDRNLGIGVHGTGHKVDVAVQTLGQTVDRSNERTLAAPNHGRTETSSTGIVLVTQPC